MNIMILLPTQFWLIVRLELDGLVATLLSIRSSIDCEKTGGNLRPVVHPTFSRWNSTALNLPPTLKGTLSLAQAANNMQHLPSCRVTPPLERYDPIRGAVDEMREQRMSMVANLSQFSFCYEAVLEQLLQDLKEEGRI